MSSEKQLKIKDRVNETLSKRSDIEFIEEKFRIKKTVDQLHLMMTEITKGELNTKNVNSACYCIAQLNETINTTISAARFLREK